MKNYHIILIALLIGLIAGCAVPAHAADYSALWEDPDVTFKTQHSVWYWLTAVLGGCSTVGGFFMWIALLFKLTRKPSFAGFFGLFCAFVSWCVFSGFWYGITFGGAGDGYQYDGKIIRDSDLTFVYWYWGLSAASTVVCGFWQWLKHLNGEKL